MHINVRRHLLNDPWFVCGAALLLIMASAAFIGPLVTVYDPGDISFVPLSPPSSDHWLGINDGGMDILSELLYSLRNTLVFGLVAASAGLGLGVLIGLTTAWFGGWIDQLGMRLADIVLAVPAVMVLILLAAFIRPSSLGLALTLAVLAWPTTAKGVRAQGLAIKNSLYVGASRHMGGTARYIITRHLLPELFPLYLIGFAAKARMAMFMEASLAFLGLFDPGRKSLGIMINYALQYYYLDIWTSWLLPPIFCLSLLIMASTFLAVSLEKVFDPRLKEVM
jgi:peptide/nickel transport system permease protein